MLNLASFWKREACGQTVLPDRSILVGQKLVENAKIEKLNWDILGDFQTLCILLKRASLTKIRIFLVYKKEIYSVTKEWIISYFFWLWQTH